MHTTRALPLAFALASLAPALLAQDCVATLKGTKLVIKGSAGVDVLEISSVGMFTDGDEGPVDVQVSPLSGTTLNGSTEPTTFEGVLLIKASLGAGADQLSLDGLSFAGNALSVRGGPGVDEFSANGSIVGAFTFKGDADDDVFNATDSDFGDSKIKGGAGALEMTTDSAYFHSLSLAGGPGIDQLVWTGTTVDFAFAMNLLAGSDTVDFTGITVGSTSTFKFGTGNDDFSDKDSTYGEFLNLVGGSGNDAIDFNQATIGFSLDVKLGSGINQLTLRGTDAQMNVGNDLLIKGGAGVDTVELHAGPVPSAFVLIGNNLIAALKGGANELEATGDVDFGEDLIYAGGGLDDLVSLNGTQVGTDANIALANGINFAILEDCLIGLDLRITAGKGDDTVQLPGTTVGGLTLISLGAGNNSQP